MKLNFTSDLIRLRYKWLIKTDKYVYFYISSELE